MRELPRPPIATVQVAPAAHQILRTFRAARLSNEESTTLLGPATLRAVTEDFAIRRATSGDLPHVAQLAGQLVRMHHHTDPSRFLLVDRVEEGYAWWFSRELDRAKAVVLVACRGAEVVGYGYGTLEDRDWNLLLDTHGAVHDIFVAEQARHSGVGRGLVNALVAALVQLGAPRVVLSTMVGNEPAQRLFRRCGFRPTMLEMTRDA